MRKIVLILLLTVIGQIGVDIYLPSMPAMMKALSCPESTIKLTLSLYLISLATSQLFYGPLSDLMGRKKVLIVGLSVFCVGSLICFLSSNVITLLLGRFIQGAGVGAASNMARAISRDNFEGKALSKVSAYTSISWATVPIVAPLIGSYFQHYFGWRANFAFLVMVSFMLLLYILVFYQNSNRTNKIETQYTVMQAYQCLLTSSVFIKNILFLMLLFGIFVYFNIAAPFLLQVKFKLSVLAYGWWIVFIASGYIIGSFLCSRLINHFKGERILNLGLMIITISSSIMLLACLIKYSMLFFIIMSMFSIFVGIGFIYPQCISKSLMPFPHIAGSAGALYGFLVFSGAATASVIISHLSGDIAKILSTLVFIHVVFILLINILIKSENHSE